MSKNTTAIVFNGGSYGTYLEWCLTTLTNDTDVCEPFTANGSSHAFRGNHLDNISGWREYVASDFDYQFVRLHPKTKNTDSITDNLIEVIKDAQHTIYIYPDRERILLSVNNFFYKIWGNWIDRIDNSVIDVQRIYSNWPVANDTPPDQIPTWIMREFLSYYLMPAWLDQVEWETLAHWQHPKSIIVTVSDFLFDFENTLLTIKKFCQLDYQKPIASLIPYHKKNLQLQQYIEHDRVCHSIVDSVIDQTDLGWQPLSLVSEAWVQWELRNRGFEIQCDGLDTLPTNSIQLRELLYPV